MNVGVYLMLYIFFYFFHRTRKKKRSSKRSSVYLVILLDCGNYLISVFLETRLVAEDKLRIFVCTNGGTTHI